MHAASVEFAVATHCINLNDNLPILFQLTIDFWRFLLISDGINYFRSFSAVSFFRRRICDLRARTTNAAEIVSAQSVRREWMRSWVKCQNKEKDEKLSESVVMSAQTQTQRSRWIVTQQKTEFDSVRCSVYEAISIVKRQPSLPFESRVKSFQYQNSYGYMLRYAFEYEYTKEGKLLVPKVVHWGYQWNTNAVYSVAVLAHTLKIWNMNFEWLLNNHTKTGSITF